MWPLRNTVLVMMAFSSVLASGTNSPSCPVCTERNILKEMTKEAIKEDVLRKLGLSSPPTVNVNISNFSELPFVKKKINELKRTSTEDFQNDITPGYQPQSDEVEDRFLPRSITVLPTIRPPVHNVSSALYFPLPSQVNDSGLELEKAELSIHLPQAPSIADSKAVLRVYYIYVDRKSGLTSMSQFKSQKVQLWTDVGRRVDVNLTAVTRFWQRRPEENLGIVVKAHLEHNSQMELEIGAVGREGPYLTIHIPSSRTSSWHRTKRVCSEEFDQVLTQCCMWSLTIDFEDFGWDWVLSPSIYQAYYCSGDCSLGVPQDTKHGTMMAHIAGAGTCCAAKKWSDLDMVYETRTGRSKREKFQT